MNKPSVTHWSTRDIQKSARYDAWHHALNANYGSWHSTRLSGEDFRADVERLRNGSLTLIKCTCDPCSAARPEKVARAERESFAAFQLVVAGRERVELDGDACELQQGDLFVWDSTREMHFEVTEKLTKVSLMMPLDQLRRWLPDDWRGACGKLPRNSASYLMLRSYINAMAEPGFADTEFCGTSLLNAGVAMLAGGAREPVEQPSRIAEAQLRDIRAFIRENLADPELSLAAIAAQHGISLRYLHWLFAQTHTTASVYILTTRLDACRNDLLNPAMARKAVSEIAFQWGFNNAAHFSRSYRARYGESPTETRRGLSR